MEVGGAAEPENHSVAAPPQLHHGKKEAEWTTESVAHLLDAYERRWVELNHGYLKRRHWDDVAREVTTCCGKPKTGAQCKSKVEKLKRRFRHEKVLESSQQQQPNSVVGSSKWNWLARMDAMMSNAPPGHLGPGFMSRAPFCFASAAGNTFDNPSMVEGLEKNNDKVTCGGSTAGAWYQVPDLSLRDHYFVVPLDYSSPTGSSISVFAREVVAAGKEEKELSYLLFLQGGPGFESPRPSECSGWLKRACEDYRVILLDQRGTGLSTSLTVGSLSQFNSAKDQASYLQHFRADNIVRDAEFIRSCLVPNGEPWTVLGQSYGGFCAVSYLSMAPSGLQQVLLTGGLPLLDVGCTAETVYHACYKRVLLQNLKFYERFPQDEEIVRQIVLHLADSEGGGVPLPSGGRLTPRGLQLLGLSGLGSHTGFERLHYILERAWDPVLVPGAKKQLNYTFLRMFEGWLDFDTNPLYALMHESIYCQGAASRWGAQRVREELGEQFDPVLTARRCQPVLFTGEMVYPWIFDEVRVLQPFKDVAYLLAEKEDWPFLYNTDVLRNNKVPVAAVIYYEDMYVNVNLSETAASQISGIRLWITNEYMHSGIREDGYRVLDQLLGMLKGRKPLR